MNRGARIGFLIGFLLCVATVFALGQGTNYSGGSGGGSGTGFAGVNAQTGNYTPISSDCGKLITMNGANLTLTLPSPPLSATCLLYVMNLNNSTLTIARNGLNINTGTQNVFLQASSSTNIVAPGTIWTDGANYWFAPNLPLSLGTTPTYTGTTFSAQNLTASSTLNGAFYATGTNCSSSASPAVCAAAPSGSVTVAAAATTEVVNTTAVTANSQIQLTFDSSLGTKLSVTCNTTVVQPTVSARTGGTSFTITVPSAPTTNPACFSYTIIN